jgi:hypothetical protein
VAVVDGQAPLRRVGRCGAADSTTATLGGEHRRVVVESESVGAKVGPAFTLATQPNPLRSVSASERTPLGVSTHVIDRCATHQAGAPRRARVEA